MHGRTSALRILLALVAAFHLIVGGGISVSGDFVRGMANLYGATDVDAWSPQFLYALHPIGAFMVALGVVAAGAAYSREPSRVVVYAFALLFCLRASHRLLHNAEITQLFGIPSSRNMSNMAFFFGLAAALIVADLWARRGSHPAHS